MPKNFFFGCMEMAGFHKGSSYSNGKTLLQIDVIDNPNYLLYLSFAMPRNGIVPAEDVQVFSLCGGW